jgi:hypothetical protein
VQSKFINWLGDYTKQFSKDSKPSIDHTNLVTFCRNQAQITGKEVFLADEEGCKKKMEAREGIENPGPRAGENKAWNDLEADVKASYNAAAADYQVYVIWCYCLDSGTYIHFLLVMLSLSSPTSRKA